MKISNGFIISVSEETANKAREDVERLRPAYERHQQDIADGTYSRVTRDSRDAMEFIRARNVVLDAEHPDERYDGAGPRV